jgi:hypothetical protein
MPRFGNRPFLATTLSFLSSREPVTFSIVSCFPPIQPVVFQAFKPSDKAVILSEALRRSIANRELYGAESKDPGDACWQMLASFPAANYTMTIKNHRLRAQRADLRCAIRVPRSYLTKPHQSSPNPHGSTNLHFVIPGSRSLFSGVPAGPFIKKHLTTFLVL